ncbi:MAG TPA: pilus assembly protein PilM [bacterium]|nr:pilus assembly protein PilM [bacterium]
MSSKKKQTLVRNASTTGFELDGRFIRVASLARDAKGNLRLNGCFKKEILLPEDSHDVDALSERVADGLRSLVAEHKLSVGKVISSLAREVVATRNIRLPSQQTVEIEEMLNYDVERHVPIPASELNLAFDILGYPDELHSQVLLFAAPEKEVSQHLKTMEMAGLDPAEIYVDVLGTARSFSEESRNKPLFCVLHLGVHMVNFLVLKEGKLYFARSIPAGQDRLKSFIADETEDLDEKILDFQESDERIRRVQDEWLHLLVQELHRCVHAFENEVYGEKLDHLWISGAMAPCSGLAERLQESLDMPVEIGIPLRGHVLSFNALQDRPEITEYSTSIGLAYCGLDEMPDRLNLLPEEVRQSRRSLEARKLTRNLVSLGAVAVLLFAIAFGIKWQERYSEVRHLRKLEALLTPRIEQLKEVERELGLIDERMDRQNSALKVIRNLYEILPEKVCVAKMDFLKKKHVQLTIQTFTDQERDQVISILRESPHLRDAKFEGSQPRNVYGVTLTEAKVTCPLESAGRRTTTRK